MAPREPRLVWHVLGTIAAVIVGTAVLAPLSGRTAIVFFAPFVLVGSSIAGSIVYVRRVSDPVRILQIAVVIALATILLMSIYLAVSGAAEAAVLVFFFGIFLGAAIAVFGVGAFLVTTFHVLR